MAFSYFGFVSSSRWWCCWRTRRGHNVTGTTACGGELRAESEGENTDCHVTRGTVVSCPCVPQWEASRCTVTGSSTACTAWAPAARRTPRGKPLPLSPGATARRSMCCYARGWLVWLLACVERVAINQNWKIYSKRTHFKSTLYNCVIYNRIPVEKQHTCVCVIDPNVLIIDRRGHREHTQFFSG